MMIDRVLALKIQDIGFLPTLGTLWRSCRWVVNKETSSPSRSIVFLSNSSLLL